jgi:hypothetical protein
MAKYVPEATWYIVVVGNTLCVAGNDVSICTVRQYAEEAERGCNGVMKVYRAKTKKSAVNAALKDMPWLQLDSSLRIELLLKG